MRKAVYEYTLTNRGGASRVLCVFTTLHQLLKLRNMKQDTLNKYNVPVNTTTLYFIYNKNSILSGRHVSTFIRSSSGPLRKTDPRAIYISMHCLKVT